MAKEVSKNYLEIAPGIFIENVADDLCYYVIQYPYRVVAEAKPDGSVSMLNNNLTPKQEEAIKKHASEYFK